MSVRTLVLLGAALEAVAMPLQAQTFFHAGGTDRTGMAVEVQRGIVAGVMVSQPEGRATSTATFAGTLVREHTGGDIPFSTSILDTADVVVAIVPGGVTEPALYRRTVGVGLDSVEFQRATRSVVLEPFGFRPPSGLEEWVGRFALVRSDEIGLVDATEMNFGALAELDGELALIGGSPDGRAGLLLLDAASGVVAGAYEPRAGQPVAFALLGKSFATDSVDGVWVATGTDGSWVGGDHGLHVQRLATPGGQDKTAASSVPTALQRHARRALAAANARASRSPTTGNVP